MCGFIPALLLTDMSTNTITDANIYITENRSRDETFIPGPIYVIKALCIIGSNARTAFTLIRIREHTSLARI